MSADRDWLDRAVRSRSSGLAAVVLALAAGTLVSLIAHELFPYHSFNHDEGVYLQQAAMLLEGRLFLTPGSDALRDAFHPWFFIAGEHGLYSKYAPVPAAVFALGKLLGGYRLALAVIAAVNIGLGCLVATAAFDRRTGLLAAAIMAAAPLFLLNSAVFLPYATTTAFNLLFAVAYVRSVRRSDARYAALAGLAIGLAFFTRPYTAVLFAGPFIVHALWRTANAVPNDLGALERIGLTAGVGLGFVVLTLGYNAATTGSALLFPYQAYAPLDGVGFGRRVIRDYEVIYTPSLALRANATVLWTFATGWFTAGVVGTVVAVVGMVAAGREAWVRRLDRTVPLGDRTLQLLLLGVVASVAVGNVAFWGNLNVLGQLEDPSDGLISTLGPFYHFDLLLPLSAFAAHGALVVAATTRTVATAHLSLRDVRVVSVLLLVVALPVVGAAEAEALGDPVARNAAHTDRYEQAYAPFEATDLEGALVFLPTTYGERRNHPFQWLRNDPDFDGPTVYALARNPADDFAVVDAYPARTLYRYRYHGVWTPDRAVVPVLEPLRRVEGESVAARTTVAVPDRIVAVRVSVSDGQTVRRFDYTGELPDRLRLDWAVSRSGVTAGHPNLTATGADVPLAITGPIDLVLTVTLTEPGGGTLTHRLAALVRPTDEGVELLWPPAASTCTLVTECGSRGTYLEDRPETRPDGIAMNTSLEGTA